MRDYQARVRRHMGLVTRGDPTDIPERRSRFGEESLEVQQAYGQTRAEAHALVDYVHDRPVGVPRKEIGAALYTLAALANEAGEDLSDCAEAELERLSEPARIEAIRLKREGRHGRGPLPGADGRSAARDEPRLRYAEGAMARAMGEPRSACAFEGALREAWEAGWDGCAGRA